MQRIAVYFSSECQLSYYSSIRKIFLILAKQGQCKKTTSLLTDGCNRSNWVRNNSGLPWWQTSCKHTRGTATTWTFSELITANSLPVSLTWLLFGWPLQGRLQKVKWELYTVGCKKTFNWFYSMGVFFMFWLDMWTGVWKEMENVHTCTWS